MYVLSLLYSFHHKGSRQSHIGHNNHGSTAFYILPLTFTLITAHRTPQTAIQTIMKRFLKELGESKKPIDPSLTITHTLGTKPTTSTMIVGTADPMPSVPSSAAISSLKANQAAGIAVSVQTCSSYP